MSSELSFSGKHEIQALQFSKLQQLLNYVQKHSPFYKELFTKHNIQIEDIRNISDLTKLPCTTKEDLQQRNDDFLCVERRCVIEYSSTSGTLGDPVTIALTENDLERLTLNEYGSFLIAGGHPTEIYQLMLTLDRQFMAGMAYYSGLRKLGSGIIRVGPGVPSVQWETIHRLKPTAIIAVPSFILKLIEYAKGHQIDMNSSSIDKIICIGENIRNTDFQLNMLGKKITKDWNVKLFSTYASTEMQTAFTECQFGRGGHLQPELLILELLDEYDHPVAPGSPGEVTITTLGVEGMPLIRYKTGDICIADEAPCACGRNTTRLSPIVGRKKQMIKFKGTTLYPPALFDLLNEMEEINEFVAEIYSNEIGMDEVLLYLLPKQLSDEADRKIRAYLQARLRVTPHIKYISDDEMKGMQFRDNSRKQIRFIDRR